MTGFIYEPNADPWEAVVMPFPNEDDGEEK